MEPTYSGGVTTVTMAIGSMYLSTALSSGKSAGFSTNFVEPSVFASKQNAIYKRMREGVYAC